ncbi:MAG: hypothetical protein QME47_05775 [Candidatus Thermoplasmatota archaeon]|nr:hypothetical protein [Candidatus Thermoplasmatota archaeon]
MKKEKAVKKCRGIILRIPSDLEKCLHLKGDESVALSKVGNKIVVEIS